MDISRMNNLPFIAGMRATPRRIVKSFFIATVMGFLFINMNLLLRSVDDDPSEYNYQGDPNYMGRVNPHQHAGGNGVEPIEPRNHPRSYNENKSPSLPGNQSKQTQPQNQVHILPNSDPNNNKWC